jgi:hypothetical protein
MEPIETNESPAPGEPQGITLTLHAQYYLKEIAKWANFLSIVGFIMCAILLIMALFIGTIFSFMSRLSPVYNAMPSGIGVFFTILIILLDVLNFFFPFYLYRFASKAKKALFLADADELTASLSNLKSFFKLVGIMTIIFLCLYAIEIIFMATMFSSISSFPGIRA